jgi:hypothetical protein
MKQIPAIAAIIGALVLVADSSALAQGRPPLQS